MCPVATAANECCFVAIGTYRHKSACIATNNFVAIDPDPCSGRSAWAGAASGTAPRTHRIRERNSWRGTWKSMKCRILATPSPSRMVCYSWMMEATTYHEGLMDHWPRSTTPCAEVPTPVCKDTYVQNDRISIYTCLQNTQWSISTIHKLYLMDRVVPGKCKLSE